MLRDHGLGALIRVKEWIVWEATLLPAESSSRTADDVGRLLALMMMADDGSGATALRRRNRKGVRLQREPFSFSSFSVKIGLESTRLATLSNNK
jgi:hypothetical protein